MKNVKLLKVLGSGVVLLGCTLMFVIVYSVIYGTNIQNEVDPVSQMESMYISTESEDTNNLPSSNDDIEKEITNDISPEKQGKLEVKEDRQVLKVDTTLTEDEIATLEDEYNVEFTSDVSKNGIYVLNVSEESNVSQLKEDINATVEVDIPVKMSADLVDWGVSRIGADKVWNSFSGSTIKIAVIDTGVQSDHTDLQGNVLSGYDFVNNDSDAYDDNGHGTHVSGIVAAVQNQSGVIGASYGAKILPIKALNAAGYGYLSDIAKGIYFATDSGARVINMSLGTSTDSLILRDAVTYAANKGVLLVAAAGNESGAPCNYPAAYNSVICVVATDSSNRLASFSNMGGELAAPGVSNYSTYLGGSYRYLSGTSMASPHIAGSAAIVMSACSTCSTTEVRNILRSTAIDLGSAGTDIIFGYGLVDLVSAINSITPSTPEVEDEQPVAEEPTPTPTPTTPTSNTKSPQKTEQTLVITEPEILRNRYTPEVYASIPVKFKLDPILTTSTLTEIKLYLDNELLFTTSNQQDEFELSLELLNTSQHWLMITTNFEDGSQTSTKVIVDLAQFKASNSKGKSKNILGISTYFNIDWMFR